jgi:hypothetical protein
MLYLDPFTLNQLAFVYYFMSKSAITQLLR